MAKFYTLDEAARVLGVDPQMLTAKAQSREVRAFLDGGSWRFRVADIDELARQQGLGSNAEPQLSDLDDLLLSDHPAKLRGDDDDLSEFQLGVAPSDVAARSGEFPGDSTASDAVKRTGGTSAASQAESLDSDPLLEDLSVPPGPLTGLSSVVVGAPSGIDDLNDLDDFPLRKHDSGLGAENDQDILLDAPDLDEPAVTDVTGYPAARDLLLASPEPDPHGPGDSDLFATAGGLVGLGLSHRPDESALADEPGSLLARPDHLEIARSGEGAEFTPEKDTGAALPDSDSPFPIDGLESHDDLELGPRPRVSDSDVTVAEPEFVGHDLSRSNDSGIAPPRETGFDFSKASTIGLAPLSDDEVKLPAARPPQASPEKPRKALAETPAPAARVEEDEGSDFDLMPSAILDDQDDPTVQLEAQSDFELDELDSGSEVFAIDEEGDSVDQNAATVMAAEADYDDDEEQELMVERPIVQGDHDPDKLATIAENLLLTDGGPEHRRIRIPVSLMTVAPDAEFSGMTVGLLGMAAILIIVASFVAVDLAGFGGMHEEGAVASGLIRQIAGLFGG